MRYTYDDFNTEYPNDDACLEAIFQNRYGDVKFCPKCAAETKFHRVTGRKCYACQWCGYQLHPLAQTIFHKSETPLRKWFYAIYLFSVAKNGVAAKELERHLGVTYKTAHRMARQIRLLMAQENGSLTGVVEVDEAYIGGKRDPKNRFVNKSVVYGAVERYGELRVRSGLTVNRKRTQALIDENVQKDAARIYTDESKFYWRLRDAGYKHKFVRHSDHEYVRGGIHTNTIEGFWGQFKRSVDGTFHSVSPKYLQSYVDEFVFRYNFRGVAVYPVLLERASKRA